MMFYRPPSRANHKWHTHAVRHHKMCTQFLAISAFLIICLVGIMLFFAVRASHSEQKTAFWVVFAVSLVGLFITIGFLVYQMQKLFHHRKEEAKLIARSRSSNRVVITDEMSRGPTQSQIQTIQMNQYGIDNPQFTREQTMNNPQQVQPQQQQQRETRLQLNPINKYQVY
jgi:phosphoglycerol transferase MdoB-like AlkP superfamily enzyme